MNTSFLIAVCAVVGAILGVFNLWRSYISDSERVRARLWSGEEDGTPRVEVTNCRAFPITVVKIGRVLKDKQVAGVALRQALGHPSALPQRIEARDSRSFPISLRDMLGLQFQETDYLFVTTALGNEFTTESRWGRLKRRALRPFERDRAKPQASAGSHQQDGGTG